VIYYLWKHKQPDVTYAFVPETSLPPAGFCSVYGVSETDAKALLEAGTYAGFKGVVHPGKWLWIDIDEESEVELAKAKAKQLGVEHRVYTTGNRGCHISIRRDLSASQYAPDVDKAWVKEHFPYADLRLYTHLHLLRQVGAIHEKTGNKKSLLYTSPGSTLFLEYSNQAKKERPWNESNITSVFANRVILDLSIPHEAGSRRKYMLRLAAELARTNNPIEFSLVWMVNVNMLGDPLDYEDLERIVHWAYSEARQ